MIKRLVERHDKQVHRILEIIPGFLTWAVLLSPLWLGPFLPTAVAFFLSFLAIFWVYRAIVHTVGVFIGYRRFKKEMKVDWLAKAKKRKGFARLKHLIVIPTVKDPYEVLETTFASIAGYNFPKDKIYVAFSTEERGEPERVLADIERIKKKYSKKLGTVWTFVHPDGIPGEAVGAAANRTWAAKNAVKKIEESGLNIDDFVTTTFDSDMQLHPDYLARLSCAYMDDPEPHNKFFQTAVYLFDNNLWDVPSLMRIQANSVTLAVLSSWVFESNTKDTWSCFSVTLPTLVESDYWDTSLGVDDTPFFWRAFFAKGGEFEGQHFHVPVYADAVQGKTWLKAHTAQYRQLLRWGWGVITFPIAMKGLLTTKIPLRIKLEKVYHMIEQYTIWRTVTFLVTFGFFLLALANPNIRYTTLGYKLPQITGTILTCAFIFLLPITILRTKITRPMPANWPFWKKIWAYLEGPLVIINLLTYALVPYIDAETRLMLGKRLEFWSTPKMRTKGDEATTA